MNPYESPQRYTAVHERDLRSASVVAAFSFIGFVAPYLMLLCYDCIFYGNMRPLELFVHLKTLMLDVPILPLTALVSSQLACMYQFGFLAHACSKNRPSVRTLMCSCLISIAAVAVGTIMGYQILFGDLGLQGVAVSSLAIVWLAVLAVAVIAMFFELQRSNASRRNSDQFPTANELPATKPT